jgi:hypothetical protein
VFAGMTMVNPISEFFWLTRNTKTLIKAGDDSFGPINPTIGDEEWVVNFSHTAWYDMSEHYITAFKTGSYPAIPVRNLL